MEITESKEYTFKSENFKFRYKTDNDYIWLYHYDELMLINNKDLIGELIKFLTEVKENL